MEHEAPTAPTEARMFGVAIGGRLRVISDLPRNDIAALDQASAGVADVLRGAGMDPNTDAARRAFAAGMICGASDLSDDVRLGMLRGLLAESMPVAS
jgi:hypothetical protein